MLSLRERDDLATDIADRWCEPGLWLLPVVALVLGLAIHRGLRPLRELARAGARAGHPAAAEAGRARALRGAGGDGGRDQPAGGPLPRAR
jgi:two-component system sensor histidine kinase QseC